MAEGNEYSGGNNIEINPDLSKELREKLRSKSPYNDSKELDAVLAQKENDETTIRQVINDSEKETIDIITEKKLQKELDEFLGEQIDTETANKLSAEGEKVKKAMQEIMGKDAGESSKEAIEDYMKIFTEEKNKLIAELRREDVKDAKKKVIVDYFKNAVISAGGEIEKLQKLKITAREQKEELEALKEKIKEECEYYESNLQ